MPPPSPTAYALSLYVVFFFQAEDGIRDLTVTGVQTCALPIWRFRWGEAPSGARSAAAGGRGAGGTPGAARHGSTPGRPDARVRARRPAPSRGSDRKSTRLNSSHSQISYAVFCLKKKNSIQA